MMRNFPPIFTEEPDLLLADFRFAAEAAGTSSCWDLTLLGLLFDQRFDASGHLETICSSATGHLETVGSSGTGHLETVGKSATGHLETVGSSGNWSS